MSGNWVFEDKFPNALKETKDPVQQFTGNQQLIIPCVGDRNERSGAEVSWIFIFQEPF